jgi:hypothetical protein
VARSYVHDNDTWSDLIAGNFLVIRDNVRFARMISTMELIIPAFDCAKEA